MKKIITVLKTLFLKGEKMRQEIPSTGILQEWVARIGLRQQGVLLTAVRGCDTAPKDDPSKKLTRVLRSRILNTHCENPLDSTSFIEWCYEEETKERFFAFIKNCDHYPHHYVMHVIHAIQVLGVYHPQNSERKLWRPCYAEACRRLHVRPEHVLELEHRLNADELTFSKSQ